ncbi:metallophosphoesterase, partial [Streptomyces somaliensis DSM 40738]|nr:metallophosphoesterase [Streptomyces somaliensis DSM 40738]
MVVLVISLVLALLGLAHRYVWCRLVRDVTRPGGWPRRAGTAAAFVLPLTALGALTAGRAGAPFPLQQALAWPGFLWLATLLYMVLSLLAAEALRPLLLRRPRDRRGDPAAAVPAPSAGEPTGEQAGEQAAEPTGEPTGEQIGQPAGGQTGEPAGAAGRPGGTAVPGAADGH